VFTVIAGAYAVPEKDSSAKNPNQLNEDQVNRYHIVIDIEPVATCLLNAVELCASLRL
jgi:hypothetical protein